MNKQRKRLFKLLIATSIFMMASCGKGDNASGGSAGGGAPQAQTEVPIPGVRADVEQFIQKTFTDSADKRQAARQYALSIQGFTDSAMNASKAQDQMDKLMNAMGCLDATMGDNAQAASNELTAQVVNTKDQLLAYLASSKLLSGGTYTYPEPPESGCQAQKTGATP